MNFMDTIIPCLSNNLYKGQDLNKIVYELAMFSIGEDIDDTKFNEETKIKMRDSFTD